MVFTFWDIPGIRSNKSIEVLERSLSPIGIYDNVGRTMYASPSFLKLLRVKVEEADFFFYFSSPSTPLPTLNCFWDRALQGDTIGFLAKTRDGREDIECSLQFNSDANLMFLAAKKAEINEDTRRLLEEYERSIALFDRSNLATALINPDGGIVKCNQKLHDLLGTSDRETLYIERFAHPEDRMIDAELRQKLFDGLISSYTIEKRFISRHQDVIWFNVSVSLIEMPTCVNGYRKYFVAVLDDITESRKIYNALIRTEEKWKAFVLNSPYLFIQTSRAGQIIYVSPAVEQLLGYREEELLGRPVSEFIHTNNTSQFEVAFDLWISGDQPSKAGIECWWKTKSGKWIFLYIQGQRFPSVLEIDGVVISGYDITERKYLEVELTTSEERFKALVENLPGAVFRCDAAYTMEYISDGITGITGYPTSIFTNKIKSYLNIIHPDDIDLIKDSLVQSTLDRHCTPIEYRVIHANGHVCWLAEYKHSVFAQDGSLLRFEGILLDVSDRKRLEEQRYQTEQERIYVEKELRRCHAINRAIIQMIPGLLRSNSLAHLPDISLSNKVRVSD